MKKFVLSLICILMLCSCEYSVVSKSPTVPRDFKATVTAERYKTQYKGTLVCADGEDTAITLIAPKSLEGLTVTDCDSGTAVGYGELKFNYDSGVATVFNKLFSALDMAWKNEPLSSEELDGEWKLTYDGFIVELVKKDEEIKIDKITVDSTEYEFEYY